MRMSRVFGAVALLCALVCFGFAMAAVWATPPDVRINDTAVIFGVSAAVSGLIALIYQGVG